MDNNGADDMKISGSDAAAECSATTIEIKIRTVFFLRIPTLRVDKCVPVPALKEEISMVTGILSDNLHLIFDGKLLRDNKLLSDYLIAVKDGDTLHLIVTPIQDMPALPAPETSPGSSSGHHQGNHSGANEFNGTSNLSEQAAQRILSITQRLNALLGNANRQSGNEEPNAAGQESIGLSGNSNSFSEGTTPTIEERNDDEDISNGGLAEVEENMEQD